MLSVCFCAIIPCRLCAKVMLLMHQSHCFSVKSWWFYSKHLVFVSCRPIDFFYFESFQVQFLRHYLIKIMHILWVWNHLEKVLWSDGLHHESESGNDSQRDVHVYIRRIICRSATGPFHDWTVLTWMKNMEKSLAFSQKQTTFAPTFWIKNGRLAQLV